MTRPTPPAAPAPPAARRIGASGAGAEPRCARRAGLIVGLGAGLRAGLFTGFALALAGGPPQHAVASTTPALTFFEIRREDDAVTLSYVVDFELGPGADDALSKGVPLHFVAEVEVWRNRWYWRDRRIAHVTRTWRVAYQPLTANYRVSFGGLSRTYSNRAEALAAVRRSVGWRVVEPGQLDNDSRHYLEFSFRLDTKQLPRPMQIGISGQADWALEIERTQAFN